MERELQTQRRRWLLGVAPLLVLGIWLIWPESPPAMCTSTAAIWSEDRRTQTQQALQQTGVAWAQHASTRVLATFDRYAERWLEARTSICARTSTDIDPRLHCLERRRLAFTARVGALQRVRAQHMLDLESALELPDPHECLRAPPDDSWPAFAEPFERAIAAIEALAATGRADEALAAAAELGPRLAYADSARLTARVELARAHAVAELEGAHAEPLFVHAIDRARRAHAPRLAARAAVDLAELLDAAPQAPLPSRHRTLDRARMLVVRAGSPPRLRARVVRLEGRRREATERYEQAASSYENARGLFTRAYGSGSPRLGALHLDLGRVLHHLEHTEAARRLHERALVLLTASLGPNHPHTADAHEAVGRALLAQGSPRQAADHFRASLRIREASIASTDEPIAHVLVLLGSALVQAEQPRAGASVLERALRLADQRPPNPERLLELLDPLADAYAQTERPQRAAQTYARASRLVVALHGTEHPAHAALLADLARVQRRFDPSAAVATAKRALTVRAVALGMDDPDLAFNLLVLGEAQHAHGQLGDALLSLETALEIAKRDPRAARHLPAIHAALHTIWDEHPDSGAGTLVWQALTAAAAHEEV